MAIQDIVYQYDTTTGAILWDSNGYPQFGSNPNANTYAQLQARIANEVLGSPTTTDIQNAVQDAVQMFERTTLWFNDFRYLGGGSSSSNLQTVAGREFYGPSDLAVLGNYPHIRKILTIAFNNRYPLNERTQQWMDDQSLSTTWQGLPTDWTGWAGGGGTLIRLYPVPNNQYQLILDCTIRFAPLVNADDYNPWTNRGERLIRLAAKMLLFRDITRDAQQAAIFEREIYGDPSNPRMPGELARLMAETTRRAGGAGKIRPSRGYM